MIPNTSTEKDYSVPIGKTESGLDIYELSPEFKKTVDLSKTTEPLPGTQVNESVIGIDQRVLVKNNHVFPYYCIGLLVSYFDLGNGYVMKGSGTATLVAPDVIITCAHNLYHKNQKDKIYVEAERVFFFPGRAGDTHLGQYQIRKPYVYPIEYQKGRTFEEDWNNDWAFLVLNRPINNLTPVPLIVDYPQTKSNIGIYGYPGDRTENFLHGMVGGFGLNQNLKFKDLIEYYLDTYSGQSGSSILLYNEAKEVLGLIGIHTTGAEIINYGNRLTLEKYNLANTWMSQSSHGHGIGVSPRIIQK